MKLGLLESIYNANILNVPIAHHASSLVVVHTQDTAPVSHQLTEVKLLQALVVLWWGTTWEGKVMTVDLLFFPRSCEIFGLLFCEGESEALSRSLAPPLAAFYFFWRRTGRARGRRGGGRADGPWGRPARGSDSEGAGEPAAARAVALHGSRSALRASQKGRYILNPPPSGLVGPGPGPGPGPGRASGVLVSSRCAEARCPEARLGRAQALAGAAQQEGALEVHST